MNIRRLPVVLRWGSTMQFAGMPQHADSSPVHVVNAICPGSLVPSFEAIDHG